MAVETAEKYAGFGPDLFAQVYTPGLPDRWLELYNWWRDNFVYGLPQEVQDKMSRFFPGGEATRADHGFIRRGEYGDDQKWFIHIRPYEDKQRQLPILFEDLSSLISNFPVWYKEFLTWNSEVCKSFEETKAVMEYFIRENFPPEYGLLEQINHPEALRKHVVRMLHYDPQPVGKVLASLHKDFGLMTADCLTTHPGLCVSRKEQPMSQDLLLSEKKDHIVVFPGRKMHEVTDGAVPGLCHGVISTEEVARGAVVLFLHGPGSMGPSCPS